MQVLLLAGRPGCSLERLTGCGCTALLPVGSRPLITLALDELAAAGLERACIVAPETQLLALRSRLGSACRGLALEYAACGQDESPDVVVARWHRRLETDLLVLRGDVLRSPSCAKFLERARTLPGLSTLSATIGGVPAGLRLVRAGASHPLGLPVDPGRDWRERPPRVELAGTRLSLLRSAAEFQQALLDLAAGGYPGLTLEGRGAEPGTPRVASLTGRLLAWAALVLALPLLPLALLAAHLGRGSRQVQGLTGPASPTVLDWLAGLPRVAELQPRLATTARTARARASIRRLAA